MLLHNPPSLIKSSSKRLKFYFATQVSVSPPTIVIKANFAKDVRPSYVRYMTHTFRRELGFPDVPINLTLR